MLPAWTRRATCRKRTRQPRQLQSRCCTRTMLRSQAVSCLIYIVATWFVFDLLSGSIPPASQEIAISSLSQAPGLAASQRRSQQQLPGMTTAPVRLRDRSSANASTGRRIRRGRGMLALCESGTQLHLVVFRPLRPAGSAHQTRPPAAVAAARTARTHMPPAPHPGDSETFASRPLELSDR